MKRLFLSLLLLFTMASAFALQEIPIASANRVAGTVTSADMYLKKGGDVGGLIVTSGVTVVTGAVTLTFKIQGKTPQGEYYDVLSLTPVAPVAGTINVLKLGRGITAAAGASAAESVPQIFRVVAVTSNTGSATYSIGVSR